MDLISNAVDTFDSSVTFSFDFMLLIDHAKRCDQKIAIDMSWLWSCDKIIPNNK